MKVKFINIIVLLIFFVMLISMHYTWIFDVKKNINETYFITLFVALSFALTLLVTNGNVLKLVGKTTNRFLTIFLFLMIFEIIYTVLSGTHELRFCVDQALSYFDILLIYPLIYILSKGKEKQIRLLLGISVLPMLVYCIYIAFICNTTGIVLNRNFIPTTTWVRNGNIRIGSFALALFFLLVEYNSMLFSSGSKRAFKCVLCVAVLCFVFFVNQSRALEIVVISLFVVMPLLKNEHSKKIVIFVLIMMFLLILGIYTEFFRNFIDEFISGSEAQNIEIRFSLINSIDSVIIHMPLSYLFGLGLGGTVTINGYIYNLVDIGALGDFYNFGFVVIIFYLFMIVRLLQTIKKLRKWRDSRYLFNVGFFTIIICGMIGYSFIPTSRFVLIPFGLAYSEYYRHALK